MRGTLASVLLASVLSFGQQTPGIYANQSGTLSALSPAAVRASGTRGTETVPTDWHGCCNWLRNCGSGTILTPVP